MVGVSVSLKLEAERFFFAKDSPKQIVLIHFLYPTSASGIIVLLKTPTKSRWISTNRKRQGTSAIHMSHVYQNCQRANGLAWAAWMKNQTIVAMNISFLKTSSGF